MRSTAIAPETERVVAGVRAAGLPTESTPSGTALVRDPSGNGVLLATAAPPA